MMQMALGVLAAAAGGLTMGSVMWPMKLMRRFQFEHWWFLAMLTGLILIPWTVTLAAFPNIFGVFRDVPLSVLLTANLFAACWGIANVLFALCAVRIGVALTMAILSGLGASLTVTMPLLFRGTGLFSDAPSLASPAGLTVLAGVGVMLIGVVSASLAGLGRDRQLRTSQAASANYFVGLLMAIVAGITSAGLWLAFVYSQGPIVAHVSVLEPNRHIHMAVAGRPELSGEFTLSPTGVLELPETAPLAIGGMTAKAAAEKIAGVLESSQPSESQPSVRIETGSILPIFAVWAVALLGGALVNLGYPAYLMTKNGSWGVLASNRKEFILSIVIGGQFFLAVILGGKGMLLLGVLGASVGAGIQQAMQMIGGQGLGFISGEWRGISGTPRRGMYFAIAVLLAATAIMAYANTLTD